MANRQACERRGETYHEDNLDDCDACRRTVCPRCASMQRRADGSHRWLCDVCRDAETGAI